MEQGQIQLGKVGPSWKPQDVWPGAPHLLLSLTTCLPQLALRNALRYFPPDVQELLAPEFAQELRLYGHIYMYRFCPRIEMR